MNQDEVRTAASAGKLRVVFEDPGAFKEAIEAAHGGNVQTLLKEVGEVNGASDRVTIEFDIRTKAFTWVRSNPSTNR